MKEDNELFKSSDKMCLVEAQDEAEVEKQGRSKIQELVEG